MTRQPLSDGNPTAPYRTLQTRSSRSDFLEALELRKEGRFEAKVKMARGPSSVRRSRYLRYLCLFACLFRLIQGPSFVSSILICLLLREICNCLRVYLYRVLIVQSSQSVPLFLPSRHREVLIFSTRSGLRISQTAKTSLTASQGRYLQEFILAQFQLFKKDSENEFDCPEG